jgi:hypothetical protein
MLAEIIEKAAALKAGTGKGKGVRGEGKGVKEEGRGKNEARKRNPKKNVRR